MSRDPLLFLEDIQKSCEKVVRYAGTAILCGMPLSETFQNFWMR